MEDDRRNFMKRLGAGAMAGTIPESISKALALPANNATGMIADVEHVVILMQENRSFDHYLGTLNGVRGYADPRAVALPSGKPVFYQPGGTQGYTLPFRPDQANLGLTFIQDLPHDWTTTHAAFNRGRYDGWVAAKTTTTMAHLQRQDIPFHFALADAFTICDAYHCSLMGPTSPNRYYMWTGWVGNDGKNGGPVIDNSTNGYGWETFPERLTSAGISWKVYQDIGTGLSAAQGYGETSDALIGNYGDNALVYFNQYQKAAPGSALYEGAMTGSRAISGEGLFDRFRADIANSKLPQVSWVVAPEAYTEHPNWPANYGAFYISKILDALTANPTVWGKTAFIITYDENDGFFDHVVPPTPPVDSAHGKSTVSTVNEYYPGSAGNPPGVYGLGVRIPCFVVSPWSKGGYVNSQVFDHTSLIRFIGAVFGTRAKRSLNEPNITPWRSAVCGDMTSAFNFKTPNATVVKMPPTAAYKPPNSTRQNSYIPIPPLAQALPRQEPGVRRARPIPYEMAAHATVSTDAVALTFVTTGSQAVVFHVRSANPLTGPRTYTVEHGKALSDTWTPVAGAYDLSVTGPNGFFRRFGGNVAMAASHLQIVESYNAAAQTLLLSLRNTSAMGLQLCLTDGYSNATVTLALGPNATASRSFPLGRTHGWYDIRVTLPGWPGFLTHLAGHLENGQESTTDPMIAWA